MHIFAHGRRTHFGYLLRRVGCAATVCDGSLAPPVPDGVAMVSIPGIRVSVAETFIVEVFQLPRFAESDVRHWRRMTT